MTTFISFFRAAATPALVLAAVSLPTTAHAVAEPGGACPDGSGVTVVVDKTDVGGDVEIGCAVDGAPDGTSALRAAGFTDTRDDAGMICAIDALPDPCPTTWEGSYWSYWSAEGDEWVAYQVGSDTSEPATGGIEGWRYNDGSTGPGVAPSALADAATDADVAAGAEATGEDDTAAPADGADQEPADADGTTPWNAWTVGAAVAVLTAAVVGLLLAARARRDRG